MPKDLQYIYKILPSSWEVSDPLPSSLATTDLDKNSGFLHMSTAAQVPGTLEHFFATSADTEDAIYLLRVPYGPLVEKGLVRWEDPKAEVCGSREDEGMFPHVYDGGRFKLGRDEVESWRRVVSASGERDWSEALARCDGWLV